MRMNDPNGASPHWHGTTLPMPLPPDARQTATFVSDNAMVVLFDAYRLAGGIARRDELPRRIAATRRHSSRRNSDLPDPHGSVSFVWRGTQWWPLFQFDADMCVRPEVARTAQELAAVIADWELALWFVTPNNWLGDRLPIDCVSGDGDGTLQAARADRFIWVG